MPSHSTSESICLDPTAALNSQITLERIAIFRRLNTSIPEMPNFSISSSFIFTCLQLDLIYYFLSGFFFAFLNVFLFLLNSLSSKQGSFVIEDILNMTYKVLDSHLRSYGSYHSFNSFFEAFQLYNLITYNQFFSIFSNTDTSFS